MTKSTRLTIDAMIAYLRLTNTPDRSTARCLDRVRVRAQLRAVLRNRHTVGV